MQSADRETVYLALFNLFAPLINIDDAARAASPDHWQLPQGTDPTAGKPFRTITRDVRQVQTWAPGEQPVLMLYEMDEDFGADTEGAIANTWRAVLIVGTTHAKGEIGQKLLNALITPVLGRVLPGPGDDRQHLGLGDLIANCQPKGRAGKDHGNHSTANIKQAAYYLPVEITLP